MAPASNSRDSPAPSERAYRWLFYGGAGLTFLSLALGVGAVVLREGRLPSLSQDPLRAAQTAEATGDLEGVRREYRSAVRINGGNFDFLLQAADGLARSGDSQAAADALARARALRPASPRLHRARGWILLWQRRFAESRAAFEEALRQDPSDAGAHAGLGDLWLEEDRFPEAEAAFLRALALAPWDNSVHNSLGITYALSGRPDKAVESFSTSLRLQPSAAVQANLERARAARVAIPARTAPEVDP